MIYLIIHKTEYGHYNVHPKSTPFKSADDADRICDVMNETKQSEDEHWTVVEIPEEENLEVVSNG